MSVIESGMPGGDTAPARVAFRPAALKAQAGDEIYDEALRVMQPGLWVAGLLLAGLIAAVLVWSAFFTVPVTVAGQGIVLTAGGIADVVAEASGQVVEGSAAPGDRIEAGQVVARLRQPEIDLQLTIARGELADATLFQERLAVFQDRDRVVREEGQRERSGSLARRIAALGDRRAALAEQGSGIDTLVSSGFVARNRQLDARQEILLTNAQIADAEDEIASMRQAAALSATEDERTRLEAQRRVDDARRQVAALEERLARNSVVRSPFAGRVVEAKINLGQMIQAGQAVVALVPDTPDGSPAALAVTAFVSAADGKKLRPGLPVEVSPSNSRREEDGYVRATVTGVSDVPASRAGMMRTLQNDQLVDTFLRNLGAPFEVRVALDLDPATGLPVWSTRKRPESVPAVNGGTLATVRFVTRSNSLLDIAIPALRNWRQRLG